jgi:arylsulfatase A-like enzyme
MKAFILGHKNILVRKLCIAMCAVCLCLAYAKAIQAKEQLRPNVVLIVADNATTADLGFTGSQIKTPNIDRLAEQGAFFSRFHASPVCSVTRAMLLTANNPVEVGLGTFDYAIYPGAKDAKGYKTYMTRDTVALPELLDDAGYLTMMVGKWHLGGKLSGGEGPHEWGFDRSYTILSGGANHWNSGISLPNLNDPDHVRIAAEGKIPQEKFYENGTEAKRPIGVYSDDLWTTKLLGYLQEARDAGKPFFAYVAYTTPHAPLQAPRQLIDKYVDYYHRLGFEDLKRKRWEAQVENGIIPADAPLCQNGRLIRSCAAGMS